MSEMVKSASMADITICEIRGLQVILNKHQSEGKYKELVSGMTLIWWRSMRNASQ